MKKVMDKLKKELKVNDKGIKFLLGISLIGFIFGCLFIIFISKSDQELVKEYVFEFIDNIFNNKLNYIEIFKNAFFNGLVFIFTIWVLGMSVIGVPINIFYYFIKSFVLGFSISSLILCYKVKGCLLALIYIVPHNLINICVYTILMYYAIKFSLKLIDSIFHKKSINFKNIMNVYLKVLMFSLVILFITSLYEGFVVPLIINKLVFLFK